MRASTLEHTFPLGVGEFSLKTRRAPGSEPKSICRVLRLLVLWGPLDRGPVLCVNDADRTALTDGPPAAGDMASVG